MSVIIFIIILLVLVLVHEWGHFFAAKRFGIRVDEFGFGFPPKLFGWKRGETEYTLNLFPIGGFVKIFGENPDEENESGPDSSRSFINKSKWKQAIVLFAGVFMNLVLAWVLFTVGFMSGLPASVGSDLPDQNLDDVHLVILSVNPDSPAGKAGLHPGDAIVTVTSFTDKIGGKNENLETIDPDTLKKFVVSHPDQDIEIGFTRGKNSDDIKFVTLRSVPSVVDGKPQIGISMDLIGTAKIGFFQAIWRGLKLTISVTKDTAVGLYTLIIEGIRGHGSLSSVTGPVGMVGIVGEAYDFGWGYLLSFAALISINLAIINLFPFPALDGGRLFFLIIEKIKGSRISPKIVNKINTVGFVILIILMVLVTYHDIVKLL
jgi:regulator of sigma E protease